MVDINKFVDGQIAAWARNDLIGMLADAGHALVQTGLQVNGVRYQGVLLGPLLMKAAAALEECWKREGLIQDAAKPENPDDVVVKVTVPDRWPMTEAGQRRAALEAAATKPMTNGDRIRAMTDEELAESDELLSGLCNVLHGQGYPCEANTCRECLIKWLGSPEKEAAPVVHGQWIIGVDDDDFDVKCSKCEWTDIFEVAGIAAVERIAKTMHYCPNCGAKMDGGNGGQEG